MSSPLARRLHRLHVLAADRAYPGGLEAHVVPVPAAAPTCADPAPDGVVIDDLRDRTLPITPYLHQDGPLCVDLAALISDEEIAMLLPLLTDEERGFFAQPHHSEASRRTWAIALAVHHGLPGVAERTGLTAAAPPHDVHAMSHETWGTGGDPRYADLVDLALREAGTPLAAGQRVLDFGCSSGRVVRMLAARRPEVDWAGCDVNEAAIAWADRELPGISFAVQPLRPELPYEAGRFDAAYAISIWSHFARAPALAWLEEMRRVIRVGGSLVVTTHGEAAIAARSADPGHGPAGQAPIQQALYRDGFTFVGIFGDAGDWGVVDEEWGTSFLTPEWLLSQITPRWSVQLYRPAAVQDHQDLYVLRREQ